MNQQIHGHIVYVTLQALGQWQGAATHVEEIVTGLRREGWRVTFLAPQHTEVRMGLLRRVWGLLAVQLRAVFVLPRADLLYVRHHPLSLPLALCAKAFGVPRVEEVNGTLDDLVTTHPWTGVLEGALRRSSRMILQSATAISAVSEELAAELAVDTPVHVIPNGVDLDRFAPSVQGDVDNAPHVLFVGALTPWQGLDVMQAARYDPAWPDHVDLVIVGDGPLRDLVAADPKIDYRGPVAHAQVGEMIGAAMATLSTKHTSARGASPLKLYESLGCGVPVIVSDVPPQSTFVHTHRCGIVIPPDDPTALAQAVAQMTADPQGRREMGRRGRTAVEAGHSWQDRTGELSGILMRLGGRNTCRS